MTTFPKHKKKAKNTLLDKISNSMYKISDRINTQKKQILHNIKITNFYDFEDKKECFNSESDFNKENSTDTFIGNKINREVTHIIDKDKKNYNINSESNNLSFHSSIINYNNEILAKKTPEKGLGKYLESKNKKIDPKKKSPTTLWSGV